MSNPYPSPLPDMLQAALDPLLARIAALEQRLVGLTDSTTVYLGGHQALTRLHTGHLIYVDTRDVGICSHLMMQGRWEGWVEAALASLTQPGMTFCDVGAHVGYYSLLAGAWVGPGGHVHAFEPNPGIAAMLRKSISVNGFSGTVTLHEVAAHAAAGEATLSFAAEYSGGASIEMAMPDPTLVEHTRQVRTVTLDEALADVAQLDVLKIDAEGAEPAVLAGARALINRSRRMAIVMEFHTQMAFPQGPAGFLALMQSAGFELAVIEPAGIVPLTTPQEVLDRVGVQLAYLRLLRG